MKQFVVLCAASAALFLFGCMGPEGAVYVALDWVYTPSYLSVGDPAIPTLVYPAAYYMTSPGTYYLEYGHPSYYPPYARYITYTVSAYPGKPGMRQGNDSLFTVWLYETMNPVLSEDSHRTAAPGPVPVPQAAAPVAEGRRITQYAYTERKDGYEISVEGGLVMRAP